MVTKLDDLLEGIMRRSLISLCPNSITEESKNIHISQLYNRMSIIVEMNLEKLAKALCVEVQEKFQKNEYYNSLFIRDKVTK